MICFLIFLGIGPIAILLTLLAIIELIIISKKGEGNKTPWIILLVIAGIFMLISGLCFWECNSLLNQCAHG